MTSRASYWSTMVAAAMLLVTVGLVDPVGAEQTAADSGSATQTCPYGDVTVVAVRGSGETADLDGGGYGSDIDQAGRYGAAVFRELSARIGPSGLAVGLVPIDYEAVPVGRLFDIFGGRSAADYLDSVMSGKAELESTLQTIADAPGCGLSQPLVLIGYSQGAHVIQLALEDLAGSDLALMAVAAGFFANPMFTSTDDSARGSFPPDSTGIASLIAGGLSPAVVPADFSNVTRTWCHRGDIVCDAVFFNLATTHVHTGSSYGVNETGWATGPGTALADVVNTVEWALRQRGVLSTPAVAGGVSGEPRVIERDATHAGNTHQASLWVSAANIVGSTQPTTGYRWDLDHDGSYELSGNGPIVETSFQQIGNGAEAGTEVLFGLQVVGPAGLKASYELCWDVELGSNCPTREDRFIDIDGSVFKEDILWLSDQGITRGCNPPVNDKFCPDDPVTREQMAAFLVRALDLTDDGGGDLFVDDDDSIFESDIDRLATAGVTRGCNPPVNNRFCPTELVTRDQMAAFLVRALNLPPGPSGAFVDDDGVFERDIEALAGAGITRGCNPPVNDRYCPTAVVTRGQMAAFLARALQL